MAGPSADLRRLAAQAMQRIETGGYSNLVLGSLLRGSALTQRDRALCTRIVYGTTERMRTLDARISLCLNQPLQKLDPEVRAVLRIGLYQALYMDSISSSAAVSGSVSLIRRMGKGSASGLVNAVLRKAVSTVLPQDQNPLRELGIRYSVSDEIVGLLLKNYTREETEKILAASFSDADRSLYIRTNTMRITDEQLCGILAAQGVQAEKTALPGCLRLADCGNAASIPAFADGLFHVQGLASQLAVAALGAEPGVRLLDLCSAPGGKAASAAEMMQNRGELVCCDLHGSRLSLISSLFERLRLDPPQIRQLDASSECPFSQMDRVLCDVPCSGLGVIADKPDIRAKTLGSLEPLIRTQLRILENGANALREGGRLVYSTCTLNPEENAGVVNGFIGRHSGYRLCRVDLPVPADRDDGGMMTWLTGFSCCKGFFIAVIERIPDAGSGGAAEDDECRRLSRLHGNACPGGKAGGNVVK